MSIIMIVIIGKLFSIGHPFRCGITREKKKNQIQIDSKSEPILLTAFSLDSYFTDSYLYEESQIL